MTFTVTFEYSAAALREDADKLNVLLAGRATRRRASCRACHAGSYDPDAHHTCLPRSEDVALERVLFNINQALAKAS